MFDDLLEDLWRLRFLAQEAGYDEGIVEGFRAGKKKSSKLSEDPRQIFKPGFSKELTAVRKKSLEALLRTQKETPIHGLAEWREAAFSVKASDGHEDLALICEIASRVVTTLEEFQRSSREYGFQAGFLSGYEEGFWLDLESLQKGRAFEELLEKECDESLEKGLEEGLAPLKMLYLNAEVDREATLKALQETFTPEGALQLLDSWDAIYRVS